MIRHHLRGRVEEAWFVVSAACFSSVLSYLSRTLLMPSSAPLLLVTFDRTSRCLGRSSLVLVVACREMIRHNLRGRAEEAWCFVSNACFSSVLSYLSRTPLMLLSAPPLLVTSDRTSRVSGVICAVDWCCDFLVLAQAPHLAGFCCCCFSKTRNNPREAAV